MGDGAQNDASLLQHIFLNLQKKSQNNSLASAKPDRRFARMAILNIKLNGYLVF
jgi:hypothetical protein